MDAKTAKQIETLTARAIKAFSAYSIARGENTGRTQTARETKANAKWRALDTQLSALCRANSVATPKTWN